MATYETRAERVGRIMGVYPNTRSINNYGPANIPKNTIPNPNAKVPRATVPFRSAGRVYGTRDFGTSGPLGPVPRNFPANPTFPNFQNPFTQTAKSNTGAAARVAAHRVATGQSGAAAAPASAAGAAAPGWETGSGRSDTAPNAATADKAAAVGFFRGLAQAGPEIRVAPLAPGSVEDSLGSDTMGTVLAKLGTSIFARVRADANYRAAQEAKKAAFEKNALEIARLRQQVGAGAPDKSVTIGGKTYSGLTQEQVFQLEKSGAPNMVKWPGMTGVEGPLSKPGEFEAEALQGLVNIAGRRISGKNDPAKLQLNYNAANSLEDSLKEAAEREASEYTERNRGLFDAISMNAFSKDKKTRDEARKILGVTDETLAALPTDAHREQYVRGATQAVVDRYKKRQLANMHKKFEPKYKEIRDIKAKVAGAATEGGDSQWDEVFKNLEKSVQDLIKND